MSLQSNIVNNIVSINGTREDALVSVDCHAHVYAASCELAPERFYTPEHECPVETYLAILDAHGITHGVIVQPSFLGTDNSYLVDCLQRHPERLRGIALVAPGVVEQEIDNLVAQGVSGVRLNLNVPQAAWAIGPEFQRLSGWLAARQMQLEIQAAGHVLADALRAALPTGARIVVDHFGYPERDDEAGFSALLTSADTGRVWVKFAAPYRLQVTDLRPYVSALLSAFGAPRILWGSDWPWTRHSETMSYTECLRWLGDWIPDPEARKSVLGVNAAELFGIPNDHRAADASPPRFPGFLSQDGPHDAGQDDAAPKQ